MRSYKAAIKDNLKILIPLGILQAVVYLFINRTTVSRAVELPITRLDLFIPFMPWTIWPYIFLLGSTLICATLIRDKAIFKQTIFVYLLAVYTAFFIFLVYPTTFPRELYQQPIPAFSMFAWFISVDAPSCCFPSSHVVGPVISFWGFIRDFGRYKKLLYAVLIILSFSIITTKQHYVWDLIGGWALALAFITLAKKRFNLLIQSTFDL